MTIGKKNDMYDHNMHFYGALDSDIHFTKINNIDV